MEEEEENSKDNASIHHQEEMDEAVLTSDNDSSDPDEEIQSSDDEGNDQRQPSMTNAEDRQTEASLKISQPTKADIHPSATTMVQNQQLSVAEDQRPTSTANTARILPTVGDQNEMDTGDDKDTTKDTLAWMDSICRQSELELNMPTMFRGMNEEEKDESGDEGDKDSSPLAGLDNIMDSMTISPQKETSPTMAVLDTAIQIREQNMKKIKMDKQTKENPSSELPEESQVDNPNQPSDGSKAKSTITTTVAKIASTIACRSGIDDKEEENYQPPRSNPKRACTLQPKKPEVRRSLRHSNDHHQKHSADMEIDPHTMVCQPSPSNKAITSPSLTDDEVSIEMERETTLKTRPSKIGRGSMMVPKTAAEEEEDRLLASDNEESTTEAPSKTEASQAGPSSTPGPIEEARLNSSAGPNQGPNQELEPQPGPSGIANSESREEIPSVATLAINEAMQLFAPSYSIKKRVCKTHSNIVELALIKPETVKKRVPMLLEEFKRVWNNQDHLQFSASSPCAPAVGFRGQRFEKATCERVEWPPKPKTWEDLQKLLADILTGNIVIKKEVIETLTIAIKNLMIKLGLPIDVNIIMCNVDKHDIRNHQSSKKCDLKMAKDEKIYMNTKIHELFNLMAVINLYDKAKAGAYYMPKFMDEQTKNETMSKNAHSLLKQSAEVSEQLSAAQNKVEQLEAEKIVIMAQLETGTAELQRTSSAKEQAEQACRQAQIDKQKAEEEKASAISEKDQMAETMQEALTGQESAVQAEAKAVEQAATSESARKEAERIAAKAKQEAEAAESRAK